jgi:putative N6-adenine-specific DNA methylase
VYVHLTNEHATLYMDTSGEALFKRGWRADKGDAPLKETLAAAMLAASGWDAKTPLYDPCCGSGTIAIEAAQIACNIAPGLTRRFGFEKLLPFQPHVWSAIKAEAERAQTPPTAEVFGSDVAFRMVDFAERNAERAGVAHATQFRGGDALQRMPPLAQPGFMLVNPPYGERINAAGFAGRESAQVEPMGLLPSPGADDDFFRLLSAHWKKNYNGWTAWVLTPDLKLPGRMRMKESRRVPLWNGPIECRMFRFALTPPPPRV